VDYEKPSGDRPRERLSQLDSKHPIFCNADMRIVEMRKYFKLQDEGQSLMRAAMSQLNLSARAYHRIPNLARTIAELAGSEEIQSAHLAETLQFRRD
jgi:magnesium chelatase family protein